MKLYSRQLSHDEVFQALVKEGSWYVDRNGGKKPSTTSRSRLRLIMSTSNILKT